MNLKLEQEKFIQLIDKNSFKIKPEITMEFLDLDKFKNDFTLFVEFSNLTFGNKLDDDCQQYGNLTVQCYLVFRNNPSKQLNENLLEATDEFYRLLKDNDIKINSLDFYNYATGTKYIVASEFNISLDIKLN